MKTPTRSHSSLHSALGRWTRSARTGFTVIELLVVVAIIIIMAGLVATVVRHAREESRKAICMNNLRQIGAAMVKFSSMPQNQLRYPQLAWTMEQGYWLEQIQGYFGQNWEIPVCPSDGKPFPMARARYWPMKITNESDPWYDPEVNYLKDQNAWDPIQLSYRGSCDGYRSGGYGPRLHDYVYPQRNMLLNEAWDNARYGARQCSRAQDIWRGYPNGIEWDKNWTGLTRHSGGTNWLFVDGSVQWIDAYSGPGRISFLPNGTIPGSIQIFNPNQ